MISSAGFSCPALFVVKLLVFATVPVVMFADLFFFFFLPICFTTFLTNQKCQPMAKLFLERIVLIIYSLFF